ncbi:methyltransferase domain-containing protein [Paenibacillus periandrae]|uniref:methyltransferase domain-containing protein n=1 Tax=Paenibacillus periandrae TaxID=1761741 RepID=UPI001F09A94B|nr:methyltransferase domain-containing protein [Paenibacillus periandrae]
MVDDKTKRFSVYLPEKVKSDLEQMAYETGLSMTQLIVMATHGLLSNYKSNGGNIFADLVNSRQKNLFSETLKTLRSENSVMQEYYGARAFEYEKVYHREDPEYQQELSLLTTILKTVVKDRNVLEVACGTGYWTQVVSEVAHHIVGLDIRPEVIQIAHDKGLPRTKVDFIVGDAYNLGQLENDFDFGLANFWFSHIPKNKIEDFLTGFHNKLQPGAKVFMADNVYVEGRGGELITKDNSEDTYKIRELADGSKYEILKNYYTYNELFEFFEPITEELKIFCGKSFWYVHYTVKSLN